MDCQLKQSSNNSQGRILLSYQAHWTYRKQQTARTMRNRMTTMMVMMLMIVNTSTTCSLSTNHTFLHIHRLKSSIYWFTKLQPGCFPFLSHVNQSLMTTPSPTHIPRYLLLFHALASFCLQSMDKRTDLSGITV